VAFLMTLGRSGAACGVVLDPCGGGFDAGWLLGSPLVRRRSMAGLMGSEIATRKDWAARRPPVESSGYVPARMAPPDGWFPSCSAVSLYNVLINLLKNVRRPSFKRHAPLGEALRPRLAGGPSSRLDFRRATSSLRQGCSFDRLFLAGLHFSLDS
jgi:hypothetical protein